MSFLKTFSFSFLLVFICTNASATRPFFEKLSPIEIADSAAYIVLAELRSGSYDPDSYKYNATLLKVKSMKSSSKYKLELEHYGGWNRLEKLGGFYLVFLDNNQQLLKTGSAIVPIRNYGGPWSDASLEDGAALYEIPDSAWFILANRLWALESCLYGKTNMICDREKELLKHIKK